MAKMSDDESQKRLKEIGDIIGEQVKAGEALENYFERVKTKLDALDPAQLRIIKRHKEYLASLKEELVLQDLRIAKLKDQIEELKKEKSYFDSKTDKLKQNLDILKAEYKLAQERGELSEEEIRRYEEQIYNLEKILKLEEKRVEAAEKLKKSSKELGEGLDKMTGGVYGPAVKNIVNAQDTYQKKIEEVTETYRQYASVTGQVAKLDYGDMFKKSIGEYGVTLKDTVENSRELYASMYDYSKLSKDMQLTIAQSTAVLGNYNISTSTNIQNYNMLTKTLKYSSSEIKTINDNLVKEALAAGIAPKKMVEEFSNAMPKLAAYGKQALDIYVNLQKQSKSLGIELQALTNIVGEQWDTYEGSARAAGSLNAILGGNYLNSVDMLNASEEERVMLLKESMEMSGKNFESMNKFEQKSIAKSLGMSVDEARKMFSGSVTDLMTDMSTTGVSDAALEESKKAAADQKKVTDSLNDSMLKQADIIREVNKNTLELAVTQDRLNGGIVGTVTQTRAWLQTIGQVATVGFDAFQYLSMRSALKDLTGKLGDLKSTTVAAGESMAKTGEAGTQAAGGLSKMGEGANRAGSAAGSSWANILALGGAALMVGAGIGLAAWGLSKLVEAFKGLESAGYALGAVIGVMLIFAGIVAILGFVSVPAGTGLLFLGGAFLMIGAGIAVASLGMAEFVKSLKEIPTGMGAELWEISKAVGVLSLALTMASVGTVTNLLGMGIAKVFTKDSKTGSIAGMLNDINDSIRSVDKEALYNYSSIMTKLVDLLMPSDRFLISSGRITKFFSSLNNLFSSSTIPENALLITKAISDIGKALQEIPDNKQITFDSVNNVMTTAKTVTEDNIKPTKDFINTIKVYYEAQKSSKDADKDAILNIIKEFNSKKEEKEKASESREIKLVIDGEEFAKAVRYGNTSVKALLTGLK